MKEAISVESARAPRVKEPGQIREISQTESGDFAVRQAAQENESDEHIRNNVALPSTASLVQKAMYYWVISRR